MSTATVEPSFVTPEEICRRYSLRPSTLKRLTESFKGPKYVAFSSRIIRYDLQAFDEWFRSYSVGTAHKTETAQPVATLAEGSASSSCEEAAEAI